METFRGVLGGSSKEDGRPIYKPWSERPFGRGPTLPDHRKEKQTLGKWWVKETGKTLWYNSFFQFPSKFPIECKACSNCYNLKLPGKNTCVWVGSIAPGCLFSMAKGPFRQIKNPPFRLRHIYERQEELPACLPALVLEVFLLRWHVNPLVLTRSPPWSIRPNFRSNFRHPSVLKVFPQIHL